MLAKDSVEANSEILQEFRSAYGILERDLRGAFFVTEDDFGWFYRPHKDPTEQDRVGIPLPPPKPKPITLFQGKEAQLFFSTRTHQRLSANSSENEEQFVFYELKNKQLIRSESKRAIRIEDREQSDEYRSFVLIDNVVSIKFEFWNPKQSLWVSDWDSDKAEFLNRVPEAVQITIHFTPEFELDKGKQAKELVLTTAVRLPEAGYRNIEWGPAAPATPAATPQTGGGQTGDQTPGGPPG